MSAFILIRTTRFNQLKQREPSLLDKMRIKGRFGKWVKRKGLKRRMNLGKLEPRKGSKISFFGKKNPLFKMAMRRMQELEKLKPKRCHSSDHEWSGDEYGQNDESYCLKCGTSFISYVFMECP